MLGGIKTVSRGYRHLNRYRQIVTILLRHGLGDLVARLGLHKYLGTSKRIITKRDKASPPVSLTREKRLTIILQELGVSFVKLGQIASTRPDLVPAEVCQELEKLQDTVPPFPTEQAHEIIEKEFGKPVEKIFAEFDDPPVASASISQVHRAVLPDGRVVAVKVQRPGIHRTVEVDLEIMFHLAELMEKHFQGLDSLDPTGVVEEFSRAIKREMDFTIEASNIERFARNFESDQSVYVPDVYRELTTDKVLTMEYVEGIKVTDIEALRQADIDRDLIARRGINLILKQIFEHGFFHADPHPGNIVVLKDNVIGLLDYGMTGTLTGRNREYLGDLIMGIVGRDARQMSQAILEVSQQQVKTDVETLEVDISDLVERYLYCPLKDIHIGSLLTQLVQLLVRHKLKLPPVFYMLFKALIIAEGNGRRLSPDFEIIESMKPYVERFMKKRISLGKLQKDFYTAGLNWEVLLRDLPGDTRQLIKLLKQGKIHIEFEHKGLEPMLRTHDRISNHIAYGIVLSSLIIGSSLIVLSGIPPKWQGIPIIGIMGFVAAGIMGFWLLVSILKQGKF